jgi:hypothetical protein
MNWLIALPVGWAVVAAVLGLLIGNGIRIERGKEPELSVTKDARLPAAGGIRCTAADDAVSSGAADELRGAQTPTRSLSGARQAM